MKNFNVEDISKADCTGCMMCGDVCPKKAISFAIDEEDGFWYPEIDKLKCIDCGLCYQKCSVNLTIKFLQENPVACYGAKSKNEEIRFNSTSGGFFSEIAYEWIHNGGICFGAEYDSDNQVVHRSESDEQGIMALRQSKYVQSNTENIYLEVKKYLTDNCKVMFCGTPCQVAALKSFLGKDFPNLVTVDFVCCGICSPEVYKKYLEWLEKKYHSSINKVWFKNKEFGWRQISTRIDFSNGKKYIRIGVRDPYMISFVRDGLSMRESCAQCRYRRIPHNSDFTLADFWGIENINSSFDDNKGVSAVIINTEKGKKLFDQISSRLDYFLTNSEEISAGNFTAYKSKEPNKNRRDFLKTIIKSGFGEAIKRYSSYSGKNKIRADFNFYKGRLRNLIFGGK